jgi:hypothetical protein
MNIPKNIKINKHLLKDMERIEKESKSTLTDESCMHCSDFNKPKGNVILRLFSVLFLPPKLAYKYCYYTVEGIPIG